MTRFSDRMAAGRALAPQVLRATEPPSVVLGVPHGGIVVAAAVAEHLAAPMCGAWVRKLVSPREPDVVIGAVDLDGDVTVSLDAVRAEGVTEDELAELAYHAHQGLLAEWERSPGLDASALLGGATAIVVDDCLVTGLTVRAAIRWARRQGARRVVVAVPVVDKRIWSHVAADADQAVACAVVSNGPIARSDVFDDYRRPTEEVLYALLAGAAESSRPVVPTAAESSGSPARLR